MCNVRCLSYYLLFRFLIFDCIHTFAKSWMGRYICKICCSAIADANIHYTSKRVSPVTRARIPCLRLSERSARCAHYPYHLNVSHGSREWAIFEKRKKKQNIQIFIAHEMYYVFHSSHSVWSVECGDRNKKNLSLNPSASSRATWERKKNTKLRIAQVHHNS